MPSQPFHRYKYNWERASEFLPERWLVPNADVARVIDPVSTLADVGAAAEANINANPFETRRCDCTSKGLPGIQKPVQIADVSDTGGTQCCRAPSMPLLPHLQLVLIINKARLGL